jgi:hypothetical protein
MSPKDNLGGGKDTSLPPVQFPVGTPFPAVLLHEENGYYIKTIMKQAESRLRKILESLKREGFSKRQGRKIPAGNQKELDEIRDIITNPESVQVAGHYPNAMHCTGNIGNECYVRGVPGAASGLSWTMFLCFRKTNKDGNKVVYIHPEPVYDEFRLAHHIQSGTQNVMPAPRPPRPQPKMRGYKKDEKVKIIKVPEDVSDYVGCGFPVLGSVGRISREVAPAGRIAVSFYGKRVPMVDGGAFLDVTRDDPITIFIDFDCIQRA